MTVLTKVLVYIKSLDLLHRGTIRWINPQEGGELEINCGALYDDLDDIYAVFQTNEVYETINDVQPKLCPHCFDALDAQGYLRIE